MQAYMFLPVQGRAIVYEEVPSGPLFSLFFRLDLYSPYFRHPSIGKNAKDSEAAEGSLLDDDEGVAHCDDLAPDPGRIF